MKSMSACRNFLRYTQPILLLRCCYGILILRPEMRFKYFSQSRPTLANLKCSLKTNPQYEECAKNKILVLGGTGFVGYRFIQQAATTGHSIVSISRRGIPSGGGYFPNVKWIAGDASDPAVISNVMEKYGPFNTCVHAIGLLLDADSGFVSLNQYASGSGSIPQSDSTYDKITRQSAFNAIDRFTSQVDQSSPCTFVFISAAEAGWTFRAFPSWLERYLIAKRAVEKKLLSSTNLRPIIFRPSLIWTWERPQALLSVIPFFIGNIVFPSIIDKPVTVDDLVRAMMTTVIDGESRGVKRFKEIESLSAKYRNR